MHKTSQDNISFSSFTFLFGLLSLQKYLIYSIQRMKKSCVKKKMKIKIKNEEEANQFILCCKDKGFLCIAGLNTKRINEVIFVHKGFL